MQGNGPALQRALEHSLIVPPGLGSSPISLSTTSPIPQQTQQQNRALPPPLLVGGGVLLHRGNSKMRSVLWPQTGVGGGSPGWERP